MRADDFYFKAGDKVMRVCTIVGRNQNISRVNLIKHGQIYCVEDFWEGPEFNVVMLVGCGGWGYDEIGRLVGWRAACFRRVDEIKLCVAAAQRLAAPQEVTHP